MAYADLFVGILIIVLLAIAAYHALAGSPANRTLIRDEQGHLIAVGEREHSAGRLGGQGKGESPPLHLNAGRYRIRYEFESLTRLALIDASGDDTLIITSGVGETGFRDWRGGRLSLPDRAERRECGVDDPLSTDHVRANDDPTHNSLGTDRRDRAGGSRWVGAARIRRMCRWLVLGNAT